MNMEFINMSKYTIVAWPESQDIQELDDFGDYSYLINDDRGLKEFGPSSYFVQEDWLQQQHNKMYNDI